MIQIVAFQDRLSRRPQKTWSSTKCDLMVFMRHVFVLLKSKDLASADDACTQPATSLAQRQRQIRKAWILDPGIWSNTNTTIVIALRLRVLNTTR